MNILSELNSALSTLNIPIETGVFTGIAPERYIVVVPLSDSFDLHTDNSPTMDVQEARLSLYALGNYTKDKNAIVRTLLSADFYITDRRYIGFENDTGYHHYVIDVAKSYTWEE